MLISRIYTSIKHFTLASFPKIGDLIFVITTKKNKRETSIQKKIISITRSKSNKKKSLNAVRHVHSFSAMIR